MGVQQCNSNLVDGKIPECDEWEKHPHWHKIKTRDDERVPVAWVQVDLGSVKRISRVIMDAVCRPGRKYHSRGLALSVDGYIFWYSKVYHYKKYKTTETRVQFDFPLTAVRYVRVYSSGGVDGEKTLGAYFFELEVYGGEWDLCWKRMPTGCSKSLSETHQPTNWFVGLIPRPWEACVPI